MQPHKKDGCVHNTIVNPETILQEVSDDVRPTETDTSTVLQRLQDVLPENVEVQLGGSVSKHTNTGDDYDVDIFIKYPLHMRHDDISARCHEALQYTEWEVDVVKGSRNYYTFTHGDRRYEIVPVLNINSPDEAQTVVDVSPLHVAYFNDRATPEIRRDVRLLKTLLKANYLYGAESHIAGISGHVADILILHYGSFSDTLRAVKNWEPKTLIDIENHHRTPMLTLNESKTRGPLIVVDPIQPQRNAAAATELKAYNAFKDLATQFLRNPGKEFFQQATLKERVEGLAENAAYTAVIHTTFESHRRDITGAKLVKVKEHLERKLRKANFEPNDSFIHHEERSAVAISTTTYKPLTEQLRISGPPVDQERHVKRFKASHEDTEVRDGFIVAYEPNPYGDAEEAVDAFLSEPYVSEKIRVEETQHIKTGGQT